jgi:hypothetical protein
VSFYAAPPPPQGLGERKGREVVSAAGRVVCEARRGASSVRRKPIPGSSDASSPGGAPTASAEDRLHGERYSERASKDPKHAGRGGPPLAALASRLEVGHEEQTRSVC